MLKAKRHWSVAELVIVTNDDGMVVARYNEKHNVMTTNRLSKGLRTEIHEAIAAVKP